MTVEAKIWLCIGLAVGWTITTCAAAIVIGKIVKRMRDGNDPEPLPMWTEQLQGVEEPLYIISDEDLEEVDATTTENR